TGTVVSQLDAREVFRKVVHGAWKTGEPGVYFIDRANHYNPVPQLGSYEATNPCGEQPLLPYDVCNLGSINVGLFVKDGDVEWERSIWGPDATCARGPKGERVRPMRRLRNCNLTTVAPTGTISIIAGCSSGIEPLFAVAFMRNQAGVIMPDVNEDFVGIAKQE